MILNELRNILLREDEEFNYYNVGFDIAPENLGVPDHEMNNFEKDMGGDISGDVGDFEDVESNPTL